MSNRELGRQRVPVDVDVAPACSPDGARVAVDGAVWSGGGVFWGAGTTVYTASVCAVRWVADETHTALCGTTQGARSPHRPVVGHELRRLSPSALSAHKGHRCLLPITLAPARTGDGCWQTGRSDALGVVSGCFGNGGESACAWTEPQSHNSRSSRCLNIGATESLIKPVWIVRSQFVCLGNRLDVDLDVALCYERVVKSV